VDYVRYVWSRVIRGPSVESMWHVGWDFPCRVYIDSNHRDSQIAQPRRRPCGSRELRRGGARAPAVATWHAGGAARGGVDRGGAEASLRGGRPVRSSAERPWWSDGFSVAEELGMRRHRANGNDKGVGAMLLRRTTAVRSRPARLDGGEGGRRPALLVFGWGKGGGRNTVGKKGGGWVA
jgi:hypothetical protein